MKTKAVSINVGNTRFTADVPMISSKGFPGKEMVSADKVARFERAVATWIIEHGADGPASLKYLRSAAKLTGTQLAALLGVDRSRVSEWENGKADPGIALWNTVAALALDAIEGRTTTMDRLRAAQSRQAEREIHLKVV